MDQIALIAGIAIILAAIFTVAVMKKLTPDWEKIVRTHVPYALSEEEAKDVDSRDDFVGAIKTSLERHYLSRPVADEMKRGRYTRNELYDELTETVKRSAGDVLLPGEIANVVDKVYLDVTAGWTKEKKRAQERGAVANI